MINSQRDYALRRNRTIARHLTKLQEKIIDVSIVTRFVGTHLTGDISKACDASIKMTSLCTLVICMPHAHKVIFALYVLVI